MAILLGIFCGFVAWFLVRYVLSGFYTVDQNELAVKTVFGRAQRIEGRTPRSVDEIETSGTGWTFAKLTIANGAIREVLGS